MPATIIDDSIKEHQKAIEDFFKRYKDELAALSAAIAKAFTAGNKILFCGNGGSSCDAMHIAGEFVGRFVNDRRALPAIALSADSGIITAVGNDYGFESIFSRQVEAYGKKGDYLIAISTSGTSKNVVAALESAKKLGLSPVLLTGRKGKDSKAADKVFAVDATSTARIQEVHITFLHVLAALVENELFAEVGAKEGPEPTRYGDWETKGRVSDF